jgi:hypothetical protein
VLAVRLLHTMCSGDCGHARARRINRIRPYFSPLEAIVKHDGPENLGKYRGCGGWTVVVQVEAYSGYKAQERPLRFRLGEHWRQVREVVDRWYGPEAMYFKVAAEDGNLYILRLEERTQEWSLAAFTGPASSLPGAC